MVSHVFRSQGRLRKSSLKTICRGCEQTARDDKNRQNRWIKKAKDVVRRHAPRLEVTREDLKRVYGWDPALLAHDAEYQYGNGCNYCHEPYKDMGHGPRDITLDVMDKSKPPYYRTNTKWCCNTCNVKKGDRGTEWFELDRRMYQIRAEALQASPEELGMLF
jgi:hypothetical protein